MNELRADVLRDLLLGKHSSRVVTHVYVTAHAGTLFGRFGATWRGVETDEKGTIGKHCRMAEKRYKPSDILTELIHLRDRTCRFPACTRSAQRCDVDHHIPYQRGGDTCPCNCDTLCRRHHRLKHSGQWKVEHSDED